MARAVTGSRRIAKRYIVRCDTPPTPAQITELGRLRRLDEEPILPMKVTRSGRGDIRFELHEGKKHQIRRACATVGLTVVDLLRDELGPLAIKGLPEGCWRPLTEGERTRLRSI